MTPQEINRKALKAALDANEKSPIRSIALAYVLENGTYVEHGHITKGSPIVPLLGAIEEIKIGLTAAYKGYVVQEKK